MTGDISAIFAYGYDLGDPHRWRTHGQLPWWNGDDPFDGAVRRKLRQVRQTSHDGNAAGIDIAPYGNMVDPAAGGVGYLLTARCFYRYHSGTLCITPSQLAVDEKVNDRLWGALTTLNVRPAGPVGWHLAAVRIT